jgi:putative oxidoreductase
MKKILDLVFNPGEYSNNISLSLLFLRLIVGGFMLTHGIGKWMMLIGDGPIRFADPIGIGVTASLALNVFAEVFCSLFLIFGVAVRLAALPLLITMLVAAFIVHGQDVW